MGLMAEIRARGRHVIGPALAVCVSGYFGYHVLHGDRGLTAWVDLQSTVTALNDQYTEIKAERDALDHRVALLKPGSLDPDMLDERARRMLNYGDARDVVIFLDDEGRPR